jgi:ketosteroid isomerase-like protein
MKRMLVGSALLAMTLAAQAQMTNSGGVEQAITKMEQQWATDSKADNVDGIASILADNFVNMDSDGTMHTKAETLSRMKRAKWEVNQISDVKVTSFGNTAIATGGWQGKGTDHAGKAVDAHEQWVDTWMKMPSGKWQCIASASTPKM